MNASAKSARQAAQCPEHSNRILHGDCTRLLRTLAPESIDLVCTDPPFGIGFMGKEWDRFKSGTGAGKRDRMAGGNGAFQTFIHKTSVELLRVLKPGGFMFMCMTARQDCLARAIVGIEDAGFKVGFTSLYWTYASGFPKALNIAKSIDRKRDARRAEHRPGVRSGAEGMAAPDMIAVRNLDGAYAGFQPKPAVEVVIVAMKPLSEESYFDQALATGKGITWLDDGRIPGEPVVIHDAPKGTFAGGESGRGAVKNYRTNTRGRFPANLLVSNDALNVGDAAHSRYFSLDAWARTLPFLIVPKASAQEKNKGLEALKSRCMGENGNGLSRSCAFCGAPQPKETLCRCERKSWVQRELKNHHPTVKPLKLMAYLITLGSRPNDVVLDPFLGSGTTALAATLLGRRYIGIEREKEYLAIARNRLRAVQSNPTQCSS